MELFVDRAWRNFGKNIAVGNASTVFRHSTITTVLGANGAGKSTLLKLLAGQLPVASGRITLDDALVSTRRFSSRRKIYLVEPLRESSRRAIDSILQTIDDYQLDRKSLADETADWFEKLNLVGVYQKSIRELSKGQRYKVALLSLFLAKPAVWILDEPFSCGLDANGLSVLQQELESHRNRGGIVIFSTQWPKQAMGLADRVLVIDKGRIVWDQPFEKSPNQKKDWSESPSLQAVFEQLEKASA